MHSNDYDVFLTPYGDTKGLYVSHKGPQTLPAPTIVPGAQTTSDSQGNRG